VVPADRAAAPHQWRTVSGTSQGLLIFFSFRNGRVIYSTRFWGKKSSAPTVTVGREPLIAYAIYICLRLLEGADIYQIAKNCRTSVEMIEKYYAAHLKTRLDASAINIMRPRPKKKAVSRKGPGRVEGLRLAEEA